MCHLKKIILSLLSCFLMLLSACNEPDEKKITVADNPETVAIDFFNALYNEKNIEKAASVCNPKLARLIRHYRTPQAVGRHLFNMSYDNVEVRPDTEGVKIREQFKGSANITLYFDGYYQDSRIQDVKRLSILQRDGKWYIDELLKDPF